MKPKNSLVLLVPLVLALALIYHACGGNSAAADAYDLAIVGGRVIDPLTGLDGLRDVYISNGKISCLETWGSRASDAKKAAARAIISAAGMVVAPGFIDIHAHEGDIRKTMEAMVRDGTTTLVGGNCGMSEYPIGDFFQALENQGCLINYCSYAGGSTLRALAGAVDEFAPATPEQIHAAEIMAESEMQSGALGVSFGIQYAPGMRYEEILALGRVAAENGGLTAAHSRAAGAGQSALNALDEMIRLARDTDAPHQFSHIGSMLAYGNNMSPALEKIQTAREEGLLIAADVYAYNASLGSMNSEALSGDVFEIYQCAPGDFEVVTSFAIDGAPYMQSGEVFTNETQFFHVREMTLAGRTDVIPIVLAHLQSEDEIRKAMQNPFVDICTDGAVYRDEGTGEMFGHPRVAGGFARWFGLWVRDRGTVDLNSAIFKSSTMAALTLGLDGKGSVAPGADADLVVFDPSTIRDMAGYDQSEFMNPPEGIAYVVVNGVVTVDRGQIVPNTYPGRPIRRTWVVPGYTGMPDDEPVNDAAIKNDFDGDGVSDLAVFDPSNSGWYIVSVTGDVIAWNRPWGYPGAIPVSGDYDGDGVSDLAVHARSGAWFIMSMAGNIIAWDVRWGFPGAEAVPGDYNGDGVSDLAVYHESTGSWHIISPDGDLILYNNIWGGPGFQPIPGDYSGDGICDLAVYNEQTASWFIAKTDRTTASAHNWGGPGFLAVPGDYNGDGVSDLAVYHESTGSWFIQSPDGRPVLWNCFWGGPGFQPVPGDYNGDGMSDLAVYHEETGKWFLITISGNLIAWDMPLGGPDFEPAAASID